MPALVALLDNQERSKRFRKDPARVCDLAASALEMIYDVYRLDAPGAYFTAEIEVRDKGIGLWKQWYAKQAQNPNANPRMARLSQVVESSLNALADSPMQAMRKRTKNRLQHTFKTRFCLGDLSGTDAVVAPSVRDLWRMVQVFDEDRWYRHLNSWSDLQIAFDRQFLSKSASIPNEPEAQALAFIQFAQTIQSFERVRVWSFCRDFAEGNASVSVGGGGGSARSTGASPVLRRAPCFPQPRAAVLRISKTSAQSKGRLRQDLRPRGCR